MENIKCDLRVVSGGELIKACLFRFFSCLCLCLFSLCTRNTSLGVILKEDQRILLCSASVENNEKVREILVSGVFSNLYFVLYFAVLYCERP